MEKIKPDVYMVGEVWSPAKEVAPYLKGIPALFNFDLGVAIIKATKAEKDTTALVKTYKTIVDYYQSITPEYIDATFLTNHDQNRILSELDGDIEKLKMAAAILMTLPGTPYIYYGEEIGMLGIKPDEHIREPFLWDVEGADPNQTSWIEAKYSTDKTVRPFALQKEDENSIYNYYKRLIRLRNASHALSYGQLKYTDIKKKEIVSFIRVKDNESYLVIHNISKKEITLTMSEKNIGYKKIHFQSDKIAFVNNGKCFLPAHSTLILKSF
jgi:glycosidase